MFDADLAYVLPIIVFAIVYGLIIFRNVGGIKFPIWAAMSIGALAVLTLQIISIGDAYDAINFEVIIFLVGMFTLVSGLESSGLLKFAAFKILEHVKTPNKVLGFVLVVLGMSSAFLINDTVALVATPMVISLAAQMGIRPAPLLITLAFGITIGSVMTPIGNPQNLLISIESGISYPFLSFITHLAAPTLACMASTYFILTRFYKRQLIVASIPKVMATKDMITDVILAKASSVIILITVSGFFILGLAQSLGLETYVHFSHLSLGGGLTLLAITGQRRKVLSGINWRVILFFISMFVFMGAMWNGGVIKMFSSALPSFGPSDGVASIFGLIGASVGLSQLMSNVPFVAVYIQIMHDSGFTGDNVIFWLTLAAASTIAGNLTILGAASNVIILEAAEKKKIQAFSFLEFFKVGSIVTATNLVILAAFLISYMHVGI